MFKFKVDQRQFSAVQIKVRQQFLDTLADPELMDQVGGFVRDRVVFQARTRKPLNRAGTFPDLSPKWKERRRELAKSNPTHSTYGPSRSNLTLTGQLLDSYQYQVVGPGQLELGFTGEHTGYVNKDGSRGPTVLNETIAEGLKAQGYSVIDKSVEQNKAITQRIKSICLTFLRRRLRQTVQAG